MIAPFDPGTRDVPATIEAQLANIFDHVGAMLHAGGAGWDDVAKMSFWLAEPAHRAALEAPWLERFPCALSGVTPVCGDGSAWLVRDGDGAALPLAPGEHWRLLALSGGAPVDLAGEWDGEALLPLGVVADGAYHLLTEGR